MNDRVVVQFEKILESIFLTVRSTRMERTVLLELRHWLRRACPAIKNERGTLLVPTTAVTNAPVLNLFMPLIYLSGQALSIKKMKKSIDVIHSGSA
jgi:hypothetical protein